jgi:hypothetical protein
MSSAIHDALEIPCRAYITIPTIARAFVFPFRNFHVVIFVWIYATEFSDGSTSTRIGAVNDNIWSF